MVNHCLACRQDVPDFESGLRGRPRAKCPNCDALERHRLVALLFAAWQPVIEEARTILDIAPHGPTRRTIRSLCGGRYLGLDLETRTGPDVMGSITDLPFADGTIDVIVSMHVLEHVPDDAKAISEIGRVLTVTGAAFVQVPRRPGSLTDEDPAASIEERIERFGQEDHVRMYGDDFEQRLYENGLMPTAVWPNMLLSQEDVRRFGLQPREHLWICRTRRTTGDLLPPPSAVRSELRAEQARRRRIELDPPVRVVRGVQRRIRRATDRVRGVKR